MPRLHINGFPKTIVSSINIAINSAAKGSGTQPYILFDKIVTPINGITEIPLAKQYLGANIRLIAQIPGFKVLDKNINLKSNNGYITLKLSKEEMPDKDLIIKNYGSEEKWQSLNVLTIRRAAVTQITNMIKNKKAQERNVFIASLLIMLFIAGIVFMIAGPVGLVILVAFAFYYHEKNKLNTWSDLTK